MAEGGTGKFPPETVMNDDDPKKGYFTLFLTLPKLKAKKSFLGKTDAKNGSVTVNFEEEKVTMEAKVDGDKDSAAYLYTKNMPEKINPAKSSYKIKDEQVVLTICKAVSGSWSAHQRYFMRKD